MVIHICNPSRWCRQGNHHEFKVSLGYSLSLDFKNKQRKHCIRCFPHCCDKISGRNQFREERLSLLLGSEGTGSHGLEGMTPREVRLKWRVRLPHVLVDLEVADWNLIELWKFQDPATLSNPLPLGKVTSPGGSTTSQIVSLAGDWVFKQMSPQVGHFTFKP